MYADIIFDKLQVLAYHYIRVLIHRPVIRSSEALNMRSPSFLAMAESSKHIVQIIQLFSERKLGFSFCLNRNYLLVISGFAILYGAVHYQQKGSLAKESEKLISGVVHELERSGYEKVNVFRRVAEDVVHLEKLVTQDLGTVPAKGSTKTADPISPSTPPNQEGQSLRRRMSSISAKFSQHRKELSAVSLNGIRRANSQSMNSSPSYSSQTPSARFVSPVTTSRKIHTTHTRPYESTSNLEYHNWAYDLPVESNTMPMPIKMQKPSKVKTPTSTDEWIQMLAVMDAVQGAQIYGGGDNTLIAAAASSSAPTITGLGMEGWGLGGYIDPANYDSGTQLGQMQPYKATPPSVSSFSSLSDEGFSSEDSTNKASGSSPSTGTAVDLEISVVDGSVFQEEELRGILAAHQATSFIDDWS